MSLFELSHKDYNVISQTLKELGVKIIYQRAKNEADSYLGNALWTGKF